MRVHVWSLCCILDFHTSDTSMLEMVGSLSVYIIYHHQFPLFSAIAGSVSSPLARTPTFGFTAEELYPPQPLSLPAIPKVSSPTNRAPKLELSLPSHLQGRRTAPLESQQPVNKKKEQQQDLLMDAKMDNSTKEKEARQQHVHQNNVDTEPGAPVGSGAMSPSVRHQQSTSDLFMTPTSSPIPSPPPSPTTKASATHQNTNHHVETFFSKATHK